MGIEDKAKIVISKRQMDAIVLNTFYDRRMCDRIGIEYNRLRIGDIERAREYWNKFYEVKEVKNE